MAIFIITWAAAVSQLVCWEMLWRCAIYKRSEILGKKGMVMLTKIEALKRARE
jgi:hypothetical protein